jgi:hypothetical protein
MRLRLGIMVGIAVCFIAEACFAQTVQEKSLCSLKEKVTQGEHVAVQVSGVYSAGPENSTLDDPACPIAPYQSTWVEFELSAKRNDKKLRELLEHSDRVYLAVEGEFYGPPLPDPKLPETLQKGFAPHWGHLGCCRTKLVVHAILEVKAVPADQPAGAGLNYSVPILQEAGQPRYPPIAKAAHVTGKVSVRVSVRDGQVVKTDVVSKLDPAGQRFLETPTVENLKTWRFATDVTSEFTVTYTYAISGDETDGPTNPTIEMLPSLDVNITARPLKPVVMYSVQSALTHETGHAEGITPTVASTKPKQ